LKLKRTLIQDAVALGALILVQVSVIFIGLYCLLLMLVEYCKLLGKPSSVKFEIVDI